MDVNQTVHQPRIDVSGTDVVTMMSHLPEQTRAAIETQFKNTWVRPNGVAPNHFALPQVIARKPDGPLEGLVLSPHPTPRLQLFNVLRARRANLQKTD